MPLKSLRAARQLDKDERREETSQLKLGKHGHELSTRLGERRGLDDADGGEAFLHAGAERKGGREQDDNGAET